MQQTHAPSTLQPGVQPDAGPGAYRFTLHNAMALTPEQTRRAELTFASAILQALGSADAVRAAYDGWKGHADKDIDVTAAAHWLEAQEAGHRAVRDALGLGADGDEDKLVLTGPNGAYFTLDRAAPSRA